MAYEPVKPAAATPQVLTIRTRSYLD